MRSGWPMGLVLGLSVLGVTAFACGSTGEDEQSRASDAAGGPTAPDPTTSTPDQVPLAWLEIHPLDLWAQPLPQADTQLQLVASDGTRLLEATDTVVIGLYQAGAFTLRLGSAQHLDAEVAVAFDGTTATLSTSLADPTTAAGLLVGHEVRTVADPAKVGSATTPTGTVISVHSAYIGLRHKWFSAAGRPARRGNAIELMLDGHDAWGRVHEALVAAQHDIEVSTWWWESEFELVRSDDTSLSEAARYGNTILGVLEASLARKRVIVGQFWGQDSILSWLNTDSALRAHASDPDDGFEFMGQANETEGTFHVSPEQFSFGDRVQERLVTHDGITFEAVPILSSSMPGKDVDTTQWPATLTFEAASFHQKFMAIDDDLAFVGGMNLQAVDWDESDHRVYNAKRMGYDASQSARDDVVAKEDLPETGPRKDYMLRIQGPAAQDVGDVFHKRWSYLLAKGVDYSENSTPFDVVRTLAEQPNGLQIQITTTLPEPLAERSVGESWFNAVRAAEHYIYIEDQYWRVPMLAEAIKARMEVTPELRLYVITKPVTTGTDPGCAPTSRTDAMFRNQFFKRYALAQLRAFDTTGGGNDDTVAHFADFDTHSKMLIVDDVFMSIGSANKNNRGILYEAEMNAAIVDPTWVRDARRRILAGILPVGTIPTDDAATWWAQLQAATSSNDAVYSKWQAADGELDLDGAPLGAEYRPQGFLYSLTVPSEGTCTISPVGDDVVSAPPQATPSH